VSTRVGTSDISRRHAAADADDAEDSHAGYNGARAPTRPRFLRRILDFRYLLREEQAHAEQGKDRWSPGCDGTDSGVGSKRSASSRPAARGRRVRDAARRDAVPFRREVRLRERGTADNRAGASGARLTMYASRGPAASTAYSRVHGRERMVYVK
jgi:hypothetical protein